MNLKQSLMGLLAVSTLLVGASSFALDVQDSSNSDDEVMAASTIEFVGSAESMVNSDDQSSDLLILARHKHRDRDDRYDRDDRWDRDDRGGNHHHHNEWTFVGCGARSKCGNKAARAGFDYSYAGMDPRLCPHENACYGRNNY